MTTIKENQAVRVNGQVHKVIRLMKVNCEIQNLKTGEITKARIDQCMPLLQAIDRDWKRVKKARQEIKKKVEQEKLLTGIDKLKNNWMK